MQSTLQQSNQPRQRRGFGSLIITIVLLIIAALVWVNHQYVTDSINFWRYQPPASVATITSNVKFTDSGKFNFYAAQPSVDDSSSFNSECDRKETGTAILGCYYDDRIYIYNVTDNRLNGIKEVTAAHEMLHAVYQRLSGSEKVTVDGLVEAEYQKIRKTPEFTDRIAFYDRTEPGERDNELHSIIGTEVASISQELEAHYAKYFTSRAAVIKYFDAYNGSFTSLSSQAKTLSGQLDSLNAKIKAASTQYNVDVKSLNAQIISFNSRAASGAFSSKEQFNSQRADLVTRSTAVANEREGINNLIDQFNTLRNQYNETVTQSNNLYKAIDSTLAPAPKV